jgi:HEAT repeats/Armadillo/beta-catenin-like repeat
MTIIDQLAPLPTPALLLDERQEVDQLAQLNRQHFAIPTGLFGDLIVGDHIGPLLSLAEMVETDDRHVGHTLQARGLKTPMASKDHVAFVDDQRVQESKLPDAGGDLADLLSRMRSGLAEIGPAAREAAPALIEALRDPESFVRVWAAAALARVQPENPDAIPTLVAGTQDGISFVRSLAAWRLGRLGPGHPGIESAVPELRELLNDNDPSVRTEALVALENLAGTSVAGQARRLDRHHRADPAFADRRQKLLEPGAADARARATEIVIDDTDVGPAELSGSLDQPILASTALDVVDHLIELSLRKRAAADAGKA